MSCARICTSPIVYKGDKTPLPFGIDGIAYEPTAQAKADLLSCRLICFITNNLNFTTMSRNFQNRVASDVSSIKVETLEPITDAGEYVFEVLKAIPIDSRHMPTKGADGEFVEKEHLPEYVDATPEILLILKDVISGKGHIHRVSLGAFLKYSKLTKEEIKLNKVVKSEMDDYALIQTKDGLKRIPAIEGDEEFEGTVNIFSRFTSAIGMPEGTTPSECEEFVGKKFKGTLLKNDYNTRDGEEKSRLKLKPSFYSISEIEIVKMKEKYANAEAW